MEPVPDHRLADVHGLDLRQLEHERRRNVRLLDCGLTAEELALLAVVIGKALGTAAAFRAGLFGRETAESELRVLACRIGREAARLKSHATLGHLHLHVAVALLVRERALGRVDRNLMEVGSA